MSARAIKVARRYSKSSLPRLRAMEKAILEVDRKELVGDIVECGVWRGGNILLARMLSPDRVCWLYDTFAGMTLPGPEDVNRGGMAASKLYQYKSAASVTEVKGILEDHDLLDEDLTRFVVGPVEQTLRVKKNLPSDIAILRLDTDWYASTKVELEVLYPRLVTGGILIVDDYGHWMGARKAVDEYFAGLDVFWTQIDYTAVMTPKGG